MTEIMTPALVPLADHLAEYVTEYAANCAWQIPLLALGAWVLVKIVRPGVLARHWLWLAVLAMAMILPGRGIHAVSNVESQVTAAAAPEIASAFEAADLKAGGLQQRRIALRQPQPNGVGQTLRPRLTDHVRYRGVRLSVAATRWLAGIYLAVLCSSTIRFLRAWLAARRLVKGSRATVLSIETQRALETYGASLGVELPRLRESSEIAGPVVVGALRPVMVLPERFTQHSHAEIAAALCHELAHVRRRDYLVNLLCQVIALPVAWHPATYAIEQRIRRTREMVCDEIAAEQVRSAAGYARCLMSLARQMLGETGPDGCTAARTQALGLFENNTMEERVMTLTETKVEIGIGMRALRAACGTAAMLAAVALAGTFHVRPAFAASAAPAGLTQSAAVPAAPASSSARGNSAAPAQSTAPRDSSAQPKPSMVVDGPAKSAATPLAIARGKQATVTAGEGEIVHRWTAPDGEPFMMVNRDPNEPTPEQQHVIELGFLDSVKDLSAAAKNIDTAKLEAQLGAMQQQLASLDVDVQLESADHIMNDPAMKQKMDSLQKQLQNGLQLKLDVVPDLKQFNDPEWQKQFDVTAKTFARLDGIKVDQAKLQEDLAKSLSDPKLKFYMADGFKGNEDQMAKLQKKLESGELKAKLDRATKLLEEVQHQLDAMQKK